MRGLDIFFIFYIVPIELMGCNMNEKEVISRSCAMLSIRSRPIRTSFLVLMIILIIGAMSFMVVKSPKTKGEQSAQSLPHYLQNAKRNLAYFQDERTGICFAFTSVNDFTSVVSGLATVDCEKVKDHLVSPDLFK